MKFLLKEILNVEFHRLMLYLFNFQKKKLKIYYKSIIMIKFINFLDKQIREVNKVLVFHHQEKL